MHRDCFLSVAERLTEPLLLLSPHGIVVAHNRAASRALGPSVQTNLVARTAQPDRFRRYLALASRSAAAIPGAIQFDGDETRWRCDAGATMLDGDGDGLIVLQLRSAIESVRRFAVLNHQITKLQAEIRRRERLERERDVLLERERDARSEAEQASLFKDELLASISHELRTPIHAIAGWVALLRESSDDPIMVERALEVIDRNVTAQAHLTEDLVDASLAITGRLRLELRSVDLEQVIRDAIESVRPAIEAKQQDVEIVATPGDCVVNGDRGRLLQVVWNLLSNATKYTPTRGEIRVVLRRVESHAELIVSDSGVGISAELLPHVFERFRRGDGTTTRRHGGLGLGLSIVRHIVELHGGVVLADSGLGGGLGQGASFTVNLPLPAFRRGSAAVVEPLDSARTPLAGLRALLVEDHDDSRELLTNILQVRGATVFAVGLSSAAQELFRRQPVDVILSDIEMPEEDGFTLMRKLREIERELGRTPVPAIAVSAHALGDVELHALRAGYQAFLPKPLRPAELVTTIAALCAGTRTSGS